MTKEDNKRFQDIAKCSYRCKCGHTLVILRDFAICKQCGAKVERKNNKSIYELSEVNRLKNFWFRKETKI